MGVNFFEVEIFGDIIHQIWGHEAKLFWLHWKEMEIFSLIRTLDRVSHSIRIVHVAKMVNKLEKIPIDKWPVLRDLYIQRKRFANSYNLLQTFISWKNKEPEFAIEIFALNDDWESNGTFIAKFFNQLMFNTCEDSLSSLHKALSSVDSSESYIFAGYQDFVAKAVENHFIDCGLEKGVYKPTGCLWYHINKDDAKQFNVNVDENMQLKPLEERHSEIVNSVWPHRSPQSIKFVKLLIRLNDSVGLFEDDNLVAWCLILPSGALGLLQVAETHRRKGFGNLVVRYMSKVLAEKDIEVTAPVVNDNVASRSLFEKLGFKVIDKLYWANRPAIK